MPGGPGASGGLRSLGAAPWAVEWARGRAGELHHRSAEAVSAALAGRRVRILDAVAPALVLGSSQPASDVDTTAAASAGVEVVRRRSGGGAVLVGPGSVVWVDVLLPAGDPLWDPDVGRAAWWLGEHWAAALERVGAGPVHVWTAAMQWGEWASRVCFAGRAAGEVMAGDAKVVGVSQRRTRHGALFQTAVLLDWRPAPLLDLLALDPAARARAERDLAGAAAGIGPEKAGAVVDAFLDPLLP